jgi:hypothetical protein
MDAALGSRRLLTLLTNLFAGLALFLSAIGLYGLLPSAVAQRTAEICIRTALGASHGKVLWLRRRLPLSVPPRSTRSKRCEQSNDHWPW